MGELRALTVTQQVGLLFVAIFGLLSVVTLIAFVRSFHELAPAHQAGRERFARELRALWVGALLFWIAWASGPLGSTLLFGFVSFFALREFVTLTHTRRADHRALLLAFFVVLPAQYVLVGMRLINAFTVFIPVYVFFAIPVISALANDPFRFLERTAKIQWGVTVCVYGMSHAPALLLLELPNYRDRGAFLVLFLVIVVFVAQAGQEVGEPAHAAPAGGARDQPLVLVARLRRRRRARRHRRRAAVLDHAIQPARGAGDGRGRRRRRNARRIRAASAQARRRRAHLARRLVGHRRGRPARPAGAALLRGAGVLSLGALVFRRLSPHRAETGAAFGSNGACASSASTPGFERPASASSNARAAGCAMSRAGRSAPPRSRPRDLPGRLKIIFEGVREIATRYAPSCASVEIVFVNVNPQATLLLGQARGAALSALVAHELAVAEYTALQMKQAIVGHGQAKKEQVQQMVMRLLALPGLPGPDAADALGLAICHAHAAGSFAAIARSAGVGARLQGRYKSGRSH